MRAKIWLALGVFLISGIVEGHAEPRVTYVGQGRYACSGGVRDCEPIDRHNREQLEREQQTRELERQRLELERQTARLRRERSRREQQKEW